MLSACCINPVRDQIWVENIILISIPSCQGRDDLYENYYLPQLGA